VATASAAAAAGPGAKAGPGSRMLYHAGIASAGTATRPPAATLAPHAW